MVSLKHDLDEHDPFYDASENGSSFSGNSLDDESDGSSPSTKEAIIFALAAAAAFYLLGELHDSFDSFGGSVVASSSLRGAAAQVEAGARTPHQSAEQGTARQSTEPDSRP